MARRKKATGVKVQVSSGRYNLIDKGKYFAVVKGVKIESYKTKSKAVMEKFVPTVEIMNHLQTTIDQQGLTIGAVKKGVYYRMDGDQAKSPIFGGATAGEVDQYGAMMFMIATGMLDTAGTYDFDEKLIKELVLQVTVDHASYTNSAGVTQSKNVITHWFPVNLEDVPDEVDTSDWAQYELVLREADDDSEGEIQTLTFTSVLAMEKFASKWEDAIEDEDEFDEDDDLDEDEDDLDEDDEDEDDDSPI